MNFVKWLVYYCPLTLKLEYRDLFNEHYNGGQDVGLTEIVTKVVAEEEKCPVDLKKFEARIFLRVAHPPRLNRDPLSVRGRMPLILY